jgi:hypothetical protein
VATSGFHCSTEQRRWLQQQQQQEATTHITKLSRCNVDESPKRLPEL